MTSAYLAISFLKQTPLPEKQSRISISYLAQEPLKEYIDTMLTSIKGKEICQNMI